MKKQFREMIKFNEWQGEQNSIFFPFFYWNWFLSMLLNILQPFSFLKIDFILRFIQFIWNIF